MKPRLIAIYLFIVLLPLGLLAWLGTELARDEQSRVQSRFRELLTDQLAARNETIHNLIAQRERDLLALTDIPHDLDTTSLRARIRDERLVRQPGFSGSACGLLHGVPSHHMVPSTHRHAESALAVFDHLPHRVTQRSRVDNKRHRPTHRAHIASADRVTDTGP